MTKRIKISEVTKKNIKSCVWVEFFPEFKNYYNAYGRYKQLIYSSKFKLIIIIIIININYY